MIIPAIIVWILAHTSGAPHWAVDTWAWMCHHVFLTVLILVFTG